MRSFLGSGVALDHPGDYGKMIDLHRAVNPTTMLGMVDAAKDLDKIKQFQRDLPGVQIIGRVWHVLEGAYAQPPEGKDDHRLMIATPEDVLHQQIDLGHDGRWLHVMNEPSMYLDPDKVKLTVDWLIKFIRLAAPEKCVSVLGNLADGHPAVANGMWDPVTWPLLIEMAQHPEWAKLGLHFYGPDNVAYVLAALNSTCKALRITPPQVVGTEFGVDSTGQGDKANGYHNRQWSGQQFLGWQKVKIQDELRPFIASGQILGVDTFQWSDLWGDFSIAKDKGYQDAYQKAAADGELDVPVESTPIVVTPPAPAPEPAPPPAPQPDTTVIEWTFGLRIKGTQEQKNLMIRGIEQLILGCAIIGAAAGVEAAVVAREA